MNIDVQFLWEIIKFLENRISMIDTKSSYVIAIETGIFALITFIVDKISPLKHVNWGPQAILIFTALFSGTVILLLLWTIRPTDRFFSINVTLEHLQSPDLIWPGADITKEKFLASFENITDEKAESELKSKIFDRHQILNRKYKPYKIALFLVKIQLSITFLIIFIASIYRIFK